MEETLGLYQLNQYIKQSLELNFDSEIWVKCELSNAKSSRGHIYFDLVEKDPYSNRLLAKSQGIIWKTNARFLEDKHGIELEALMATDAEMRLLVHVDYHEVYGLKLIVTDLDPNYSLGQLEKQRKETLAQLESQKLLDKNKRLPMPEVVQRIAVISSATAAGYIDFTKELASNPYGYYFEAKLFNCAVQGQKVNKDVKQALSKIVKNKTSFDAIMVLRGGGSKLDLAAFDDYDLCQMLANSPLPVITGIGHEIDTSIADLVAHTQVKTPTAAAGFLIQKAGDYHARMQEVFQETYSSAERLLNYERLSLHQLWSNIHARSVQVLSMTQMQIDRSMYQLKQELTLLLQDKRQQWKVWLQELNLRSPEGILKQGYAILEQGDQRIGSIQNLDPDQKFVLHMHDGKIKAKKLKDGQEKA